ncbi:hypothetical protein G6F59_016972 [Rhizopus arrhizus]|nr:hypothetical protein G6F59_016972 [Rhizopus arrhizus]
MLLGSVGAGRGSRSTSTGCGHPPPATTAVRTPLSPVAVGLPNTCGVDGAFSARGKGSCTGNRPSSGRACGNSSSSCGSWACIQATAGCSTGRSCDCCQAGSPGSAVKPASSNRTLDRNSPRTRPRVPPSRRSTPPSRVSLMAAFSSRPITPTTTTVTTITPRYPAR